MDTDEKLRQAVHALSVQVRRIDHFVGIDMDEVDKLELLRMVREALRFIAIPMPEEIPF